MNWSTRKKWNFDSVSAEMSKYSRRSDFQKASVAAYRFARINGMLDTHFQSKRVTYTRKWTVEAVTTEASKFSSRVDFYRENGSAYNAAKKLGLLDSLFGFVRNQWSEDSLRDEASKYSSRIEFYRKSGSAYATALKRGMIGELFPERFGGTDDDVIYIWLAVGQVFNGNPVYKIGVTSSRLGTIRIEQVAKSLGVKFITVCQRVVVSKASDIEKVLHGMGESPMYVGFNGASEFRSMSDTVLCEAIAIINEAV